MSGAPQASTGAGGALFAGVAAALAAGGVGTAVEEGGGAESLLGSARSTAAAGGGRSAGISVPFFQVQPGAGDAAGDGRACTCPWLLTRAVVCGGGGSARGAGASLVMRKPVRVYRLDHSFHTVGISVNDTAADIVSRMMVRSAPPCPADPPGTQN